MIENDVFLGNFLITYIRTWQIFMNRLCIARFEFNTYIVSILVIFFLQVEFGEDSFPTVDELLQANASVNSNISNFRPILRQFFYFYGHRYQMWNHIISINIGRWQERRVQAEQRCFSPAQQRFAFKNTI